MSSRCKEVITLDNEDLKKCLTLSVDARGHTVKEAGRKMGIDPEQVRGWVRGNGVIPENKREQVKDYCRVVAEKFPGFWKEFAPVEQI